MSIQGARIVIFLSLLVLAACSSPLRQPEPAPSRPRTTAVTPAPNVPGSGTNPAANGLPAANSGRGGYYKDDGPADMTPENLLATPNAVPKVELYSVPGNRPYAVFGKTYTPITDDKPFVERGIASWYGKKFHGQKTSSGEKYDMFQMTAAHPTLPIPSYARVTNLASGTQIIVRINDRGPFHSSRIIDLSYTAALKLGYLASGSSLLEVERLLPEQIRSMQKGLAGEPLLPMHAQLTPPIQTAQTAQTAPVKDITEARMRLTSLRPDAKDVIGDLIDAATLRQERVTPAGIYLQFGVYAQIANAEAFLSRLLPKWADDQPAVDIVEAGAMVRILSGPYAGREAANAAALKLQRAGFGKPMVVER